MLRNNKTSEQLDVAVALEKQVIRDDSLDHIVPAYRYQLLDIDGLESLSDVLKQSEQQKLAIIASPALYNAETRLQATVYLHAIRVNIASIATVVAQRDITNEEEQ